MLVEGPGARYVGSSRDCSDTHGGPPSSRLHGDEADMNFDMQGRHNRYCGETVAETVSLLESAALLDGLDETEGPREISQFGAVERLRTQHYR